MAGIPAPLSFNHYLCPPGYGVVRFMDLLAGEGVTGIGLTLAALEELGAAGCRRAAEQRGLAVSSLNSAGNFTLTDPAALASARDRNLRLIEAAAETGAAMLVVVTGGLSGQIFSDDAELRNPAIQRPDEALARCRDELGWLAERARPAGVRLALEPIHPMDILFKGVANSIAGANALIRDLEGVGLIVDLYHSWWDADLYALPPSVLGVQICGLRQSSRDEKPDRDVLGFGIVNPVPALEAVRRVAPSAVIEIEIFDRHRRGRPVEDMVRASLAAWSELSQEMEAAQCPSPICPRA